MKRTLSALAIAGAMLLGMALTPGYGHAQDQTAPQDTPQAATKTQTFVGVMQGPGQDRQWTKPILYDQVHSANYYVDVDNEKADKYIGHKVKITGTLDKKTNIIHPKSIQAM